MPPAAWRPDEPRASEEVKRDKSYTRVLRVDSRAYDAAVPRTKTCMLDGHEGERTLPLTSEFWYMSKKATTASSASVGTSASSIIRRRHKQLQVTRRLNKTFKRRFGAPHLGRKVRRLIHEEL